LTTVTTITPPCRPAPKECESLSQHEFGLNGMDDVGRLHSQEHVSVSEIRQRLQFRRLPIGERYDNLAAQQRNNPTQIRAAAQAAGVKLPALDVLQPTAGAEVLQIVHDRLLGAFLLKRNLQYAAADCGQGALAPTIAGASRMVSRRCAVQLHRRCRMVRTALPGSLPESGGHAGVRGRSACEEGSGATHARRAPN